MEEKLFKQALDFIKKYEIDSYAINIHPHPHRWGKGIKIHGDAFENYKAMIDSVKERRRKK